MIKISRLADYATVLMTRIARDETQLYSAQLLAETSKIHLPTVSKLLKRLTQAGLLLSQRGSQGGYHLAKKNHEITLTHIVSAIDGNIALTECAGEKHPCAIEPFCSLSDNWRLISRVIHSALSSITLADMLQHHQKSKFSKQLQTAISDAAPITWSRRENVSS